MVSHKYDVAILGAGPYGLAASAHLCRAGFQVIVFGRALEFWKEQMPEGMLLRSSWDASHISDPQNAWTINTFQAAKGMHISKPIPKSDFVRYGEWFQTFAAPALDPRRVQLIQPNADGFELVLEDQEVVRADRMVVAAGIAPFAYIPPQFAGLPSGYVSHTADHKDLAVFARRRMIVVGSGQSAIESAALLKEAGADVEVIARAPALRWLSRRAGLQKMLPVFVHKLLYPPTDVGPPILNQLVARPNLFRRFPAKMQTWMAYRAIRPAASGWLFSRVDSIRMTFGRQIQAVQPNGKELAARLDDGEERRADHILLATGYQVDVRKYAFLSDTLRNSLSLVNGYPLLTEGLESSHPGLHFLGAPAAYSFGPLMRFVSGTDFAARSLTRRIVSARGQQKPSRTPPRNGDR